VENSLRMIAEEGRGALVYLHNGSAGFGIDRTATPNRVIFHREHRLKEKSDERAHRTLRQVGLGGQILSDLGIHKIRLLTNTPTHVPALQGFDIEIVEQVPVSLPSAKV
jgi:3,4-dihydroxy 2-butanone 4-phosphate synthase / GTP cyclohydrolase II